ncbi:hypothetical protein DOTSEDRAFT_165347 [Dothistroma septosporum NZE10]|uniref:UBZ4-type domain-containing protein n=1 Tax=Dothistroma septosporum (strain NZE10 / CBS 128990) TaxID=675120 RepID=N1Q3J3_DOTSN|nr:hypothetical protein DOTSEDRAFT_165347 [Dothistroma septosporum NZE10]
MNRPKNRQPRPPRDQSRGGRGGRGGVRGGGNSRDNPRPEEHHAVPNKQQVVPGAGVFIVLKEDQPTGRETHGIVQDLLTRGDHPRGIKVRLSDGQVGRVQRMSGDAGDGRPHRMPPASTTRTQDTDDFSGPPARTLADYLPSTGLENAISTNPSMNADTAMTTAICPVCGQFEGDEMAVSHHVETHFS